MIARTFSQNGSVAGFISLSLLGLVTANVATAQSAKPITVIAHDYAFVAPDTAHAGGTVFSLQNKGAVRHEVVVILLKRGRSSAEYLKATTPEERRALNDGVIGLILAEPAQAAPGQLLTGLQKGRSYLLVCNLRDTPEKPPHAQLGMIATLHVK